MGERWEGAPLVVAEAMQLGKPIVSTRVGSLLLSGCRSDRVDVSGAGLLRLEGLDWLRGVTLSAEQAADLAPALLRHLGGTIADPA